MNKPSLRRRWSEGDKTIGAWCFHPDELGAEVIAKCGYDYVCIDMQHGLIDFDKAVAMIRSIDLGDAVPVARLWWNDPALIGRVLDAGAMGVIVPMINSPEDARAAVAAARYAPAGERSFGPIRVDIRDGGDYFLTANDEIAVIPMIETAQALAHVEDIVAVEGVDAVYVGVYDLSLALGLAPGNNDDNPVFDAAIQRVLAACSAAGIVAGCHSGPGVAARRLRQGFQMVTASADLIAIQSGMRAHLAAAREGLNDESS